MVTLILKAGDIPDGTVVRKPTGEQTFLMRRTSLSVYTYQYCSSGQGKGQEVTIYGAGYLHMTSKDSIQLLGVMVPLAIDFDNYVDAAEFLMEINDEE